MRVLHPSGMERIGSIARRLAARLVATRERNLEGIAERLRGEATNKKAPAPNDSARTEASKEARHLSWGDADTGPCAARGGDEGETRSNMNQFGREWVPSRQARQLRPAYGEPAACHADTISRLSRAASCSTCQG